MSEQWAAGFDNEAGLVDVSADVPAYQSVLFTVRSVGPGAQKPEGIFRPRADKMTAETGDKVMIWVADGMIGYQYDYIRVTYTPGGTGYSAKMTIRTLTGYATTTPFAAIYANFNATLQLPPRSTLSAILNGYTAVPLRFIIKAAL